MRILLVANGYPPGAMGGVETYTRHLARALGGAGFTVRVFCREEDRTRDDGAWRDDDFDGLRVRRVANNFVRVSGFADYYVNTGIEATFRRTLRDWLPDVVHFQHAIGLSASLPLVAAADSVPTVWTLWDYWPLCPINTLLLADGTLCPGSHHAVNCFRCVYGSSRPLPGRHVPDVEGAPVDAAPVRHPFGLDERTMHALRRRLPRGVRLRLLDVYNALQASGRRLAAFGRAGGGPSAEPDTLPPPAVAYRAEYMRRVLLACNRIVAPLPFVAETYVAFGIPRERIQIVEPGMDVAAWHRAPRGQPPPDRALRLGYIGSLMRHKGVDTAIEALALVPDADVELRLHGFFVQGDPHADELRRRIRRDRRVRVMGPYEHGDLPRILGDIDVLLMPAKWHETFSFVTREAVLAGLPVLASNMGGMRYAVEDGVNGRLLPPGSPEAWADTIARIADDRREVARMSAACGQVRIRSTSEDAADLAGLYEALVASHGAEPGSGA